MGADLRPRIKGVIAAVLGVPFDGITDATGPDTVEGWDSMNHIHLVVALEAEFDVSFEPEQAVDLTSVAAIEQAITTLGAR